MLSNLLQELALAKDYGRKHIVLDEARLNENPVDRLSRMMCVASDILYAVLMPVAVATYSGMA